MVWYYSLIPPDIKIVSNIKVFEPLTDKFTLKEADFIIYFGNIAFRDPKGIKVGIYTTLLEDGKTLVFKQRFLGSDIYILLSNLENKPTYLYASTSINRVVKLPLLMRDLVRFNDLVNSIILVKLIQRGWFLAHSASLLTSSSLGFLITGYPDTGKTTTTYLLSQLKGFIPLSDDLTYISENAEFIGEGLSSQSLSGQAEREYFKKMFYLFKLRITLSKVLNYLSYVPYSPNFLSNLNKKIIPSIPVTIRKHPYSRFKCKYLFILELGNEEEVIEIDKELAKRKFLEINRREHYFFNHNFMLLTYSYFNKNFDLESVYRKRAEIISNFVNKTNTYIIRARKSSEFYRLILHVLEREGQ